MIISVCRYDISNDGQIDKKELTKLISAMYDLVGETDRKGDKDPKHRAEDIIKKLDVSGDKKLNKQEFIAGYSSSFLTSIRLSPSDFLRLDAKTILSFVEFSLQMLNHSAVPLTFAFPILSNKNGGVLFKHALSLNK